MTDNFLVYDDYLSQSDAELMNITTEVPDGSVIALPFIVSGEKLAEYNKESKDGLLVLLKHQHPVIILSVELSVYRDFCDTIKIQVSELSSELKRIDVGIFINNSGQQQDIVFASEQSVGEISNYIQVLHDSPHSTELISWLTFVSKVDNERLSIAARSNGLPLNNSDILDLKQLASAQNWSDSWSYTVPDYYDKKSDTTKTNHNQVNFSIYSVHSAKDDCDYYFLMMEGLFSAGANFREYKFNYDDALSKIQEYYISSVRVKAEPVKLNGNGDPVTENKVVLSMPTPETTQGETVISSSLEMSLGGNVSFSTEKGKAIQCDTGVKFSNTRTSTIKDLIVELNALSSGPSTAEWEYKLKKTETSFSFFSYGQVELYSCADAAKATLRTCSQWVFKYPPELRNTKHMIRCNADVTVESSRGRLTAPCYTNPYHKSTTREHGFTFELQKPPIL